MDAEEIPRGFISKVKVGFNPSKEKGEAEISLATGL